MSTGNPVRCVPSSLLRAAYPDERAGGEFVKQWHQVAGGNVNAAAGCRTPERGFIADSVDVNVAGVGIDDCRRD